VINKIKKKGGEEVMAQIKVTKKILNEELEMLEALEKWYQKYDIKTKGFEGLSNRSKIRWAADRRIEKLRDLGAMNEEDRKAERSRKYREKKEKERMKKILEEKKKGKGEKVIREKKRVRKKIKK
jgi:hypothetical protein